MKNETIKVVVLDNIRSVHNAGSIFRTSDAAAVDKIYLCGTTPTPLDRFNRERGDFKKTALGAEKNVQWEYAKDTVDLVNRLKKVGFFIVAVEQSPKSENYKNLKIPNKKIAFIFGSETIGVSKEVLSLCDVIIDLPMKGGKESLNVSVTVGIILFHFSQ
jgi:tRNA G18 (ribose-2'-O)-methylase SpoU